MRKTSQKFLQSNLLCRVALVAILLAFQAMLGIGAGVLYAQKVTGTVISGSDNEPLIGASVMVQGTKVGSVTDLDGNFTIDAKNGQTLEVSYLGFITQKVKVNGQKLNITLQEDKHSLDEVVVVEAEALFLLIEIAVEDDVPRRVGALVLFAQRVERHRDHVLVILRLLEELADLDHVPCGGIGHVAQCEAALFVDDAEHRVDVGIIQHEEALRVLHRMAVLLQNGDTEAVERVDIARVVVAGQGVDTLAHLVG